MNEEVKKEQKPFSEVATEFADKTAKQAVEDPESMKIENKSAMDQVEFASRFFNMYFKVFVNMIDSLPKKSAARVINRIMAYPLETPSEMSWTSEKEKNAFLIGNQLAETKYLLYKYTISEEVQKAQLEQETVKGVNNEEKSS